jgi:hypothetical protein
MRKGFMAVATLLLLAAAGPALAKGKAKAPKCDQCSDLPALASELRVQEAIYSKVRQYVRNETDYQLIAESPEKLQEILQRTANDAAGGGGDGEGGGNASPLLTVDVTNKKCKMYLLKDGERKPFKKKALKKMFCAPVANYVFDHENAHRVSCKQYWKNGQQDEYGKTEVVAADEMQAYWKGIVSLRQSIASLARRCGWEDSCATTLPGPNTVTLPPAEKVPCQREIQRLQYNTRRTARALYEATPRD